MPCRLVLSIALLMLLPAFAAAESPPPITDATVVQNDGWTHRHVTVALLEGGQSVRITRDDGESLVLPAESVAMIRDAAGRNVTYLLIPGAEPPAPGEDLVAPPPPEVKTPIPRRDELRPFTIALGGGLGYGHPSGDFYTGLDDGRLIYGDLRYTVAPRAYIKFCYRVQDVFDGQAEYIDRDEGYTLEVGPASAEIRQYLFTFGFLSGATPGNLLRTYGEFGVGYGDHVATIDADSAPDPVHEERWLLTAQGGVIVPFGSSPVGLELGVSLIAKLWGGNDGEGSGVVFAGQAGLVVLFGRDS